jgi:hypothetical protein
MMDKLSLAKARGELEAVKGTPIWELYVRGRETQLAIEAELGKTLAAEGNGRERVVANWMQSVSDR